jgi:uncharacterized protein (TIGR02466 family)
MAGELKFSFTTPGDGSAAPSTNVANAPMLQSYDLFPTRIWQARRDDLVARFETWVDVVLAMRAANPKPAGRTNRQGWNSADMRVLERPEFADLRQTVIASCTQAFAEMGRRGIRFQLQSWVNMHDRGGFNFLHIHEGSLLSGTFYLQVPAGSGKFVLRDPRPGVVHGYFRGATPNSASDIHITPSAGLLVLFPHWVEHFVEPHDSDEPRIAIAFNANMGDPVN